MSRRFWEKCGLEASFPVVLLPEPPGRPAFRDKRGAWDGYLVVLPAEPPGKAL